MELRNLWVSLLLWGLSVGMISAQENWRELALQHISSNPNQWQLTEEDVANLKVTDLYTTEHNGVTHVYLRQMHKGIEVEGAFSAVHFWKGQAIQTHMQFVSDLKAKVSHTQPQVPARTAIMNAAQALNLSGTLPTNLQQKAIGAEQLTHFQGGSLSNSPISARLVYLPIENSQLQLSWKFSIETQDLQHVWNSWVDAHTGKLLKTNDAVIHCQFGPSFLQAEEDPIERLDFSHALPAGAPRPLGANEYNVYPFPVESPNHGNRALVSDPSDAVASPYGWHDTNGAAGAEFTITRGNNVWALEDIDGNNNTTGVSPNGGSSLHFDFPIDLGQNPSTYTDAATVNLFYWNNLMHDVWHRYGFDEPSGNFQENNYGRGGQGGDFVVADAQDGSFFNNANFFPPIDGFNGRMQMFLWTGGGLADFLRVNSPPSIVGPYGAAGASFGPPIPNNPLTADLILADDSSGCGVLVNAAAVSGKIALVYRTGPQGCNFVTKAENVQAAGAVAMIVINNLGNGQPFNMAGQSGNITIPSIMVSFSTGESLRTALDSGETVNVTIQNTGNPDFTDGTLDNGIICHEYGHGISTRLTGGPSVSCLNNQEQAGEGWSDWFTLVMSVKPGDNGATPRGIGTFALGQQTNGGGFRTHRYSTDMSINPHTYDAIRFEFVPHGVGSVMCAMLWDLYWNLVDEYGYDPDIYTGTGGNNIAMQLVIDGMKLQPCNPGFVDVRDAILMADQINNGGANQRIIWKTFARRGLGVDADQGSSNSRSDGTESFEVPDEFKEILVASLDSDVDAIVPGGEFTYTFSLKNQKVDTVTNLILVDTLPPFASYVAGTSSVPVVENGGVLTFQLGDINPGETLTATFDVAVATNAPVSSTVYQDDLESGVAGYMPQTLSGSNNGWTLASTNPRSGSFSWFIANTVGANDHVLQLPIQLFPTGSNPVLSFWHEYETDEGNDGGVMEILRQSQQGVWSDLGPNFVKNGYNSTLSENTPIGEARPAFSGKTNGYIRSRVDLKDFENEGLLFRLRFASNFGGFGLGWWVDDFDIQYTERIANRVYLYSDQGDSLNIAQSNSFTQINPGNTAVDPEANLWQIDIFPNPAQDILNLKFHASSQGQVNLSLSNLLGQTLEQKQLGAVRAGEVHTWNLANLPAGIYLIQVQHENQIYTQRLRLE